MKICSSCQAQVSDEAEACPKCGATTFATAEEDLEPIRRVHAFFSVEVFYAKPKPPIIINGEPVAFPIDWKLLKVRPKQYAPPIFVWERDGLVSPGRPEAALNLVEGEDLVKVFQALPNKKIKEIEKVLREEWALVLGENEELFEHVKDKFYQTVPRLKNPKALEAMDWRGYVERLVCPKEGKDSVLIEVHKAKLLKPLTMKYAPHSIEVTNSGTGKSAFYSANGILVDKATRRSVLGYAKSPNEVYPGTINGTQLPTAFDQIESQDSYELARYMFNILETGRALVDAGGFRFPIETESSFAYLGNPIARDAKIIQGFRALIEHISGNPALGRRFGIILFRTDLKPIRGTNKMSLPEEEEWKNSFILFRAVEEYAQPKFEALIHNPKVIEWLHTPIKGYRETIANSLMDVEDYNIKAFFEAHTEGEHRVRGAAFHSAVASLLDKIVLNKVTIEEILGEANEVLNEYVSINLESIADLAALWDRMRVDQAKTYFSNLSDYLKEIVSAAIHYKRASPEAVSVDLASISYEPENKTSYPYFSQCINRLKKRKRMESLNERVRDYFGFQLLNKNGTFAVQYFENPRAPDDLPLMGNLSISPISPFIHNSKQTELEKQEPTVAEGVSQNMDKWIKRRNGEKTEDKTISVTCGSCEFFSPSKCPKWPKVGRLQPTATYTKDCPNYRGKVSDRVF